MDTYKRMCKETATSARKRTGISVLAIASISLSAVEMKAQEGGTDTACVRVMRFLGPRATAEQQAQARQCINATDNSRRIQALRIADPAVKYIGVLPWTVPEYQDEQRLSDGVGGFGPMAYIYASPALGTFTSLAQFAEHGDRGVLVGVVSLLRTFNSETLPDTYKALQLRWGLNCIYLSYRPAGWRGYVTNSGTTGTVPCAATPPTTPAGWLEVKATRYPPYGQKDNPPVARFSETAADKPLLGVACLDAWCEIGPDASNATATPEYGGPQVRIKGWHDEQVLSERQPNGSFTRSVSAKVIPRPDIDRLTLADFADWVDVAVIKLTQNPPQDSKYYKWGLRRGDNTLALRLTGSDWEAQVTVRVQGQSVTRRWMFPEPRHEHRDAAVPGTARFRWTVADEGVWVPCGQGCCKVEGIAAN